MRVLTARRNVHPKVVQAWQEYLDTCRDARLQNQITIEEIEKWAWQRLRENLQQIARTQ